MDFLGKKCPICSKNFHEYDDIVVCPKCGAPYHRECYKEKGKCIFPDLHKTGERWYDEDEKAEKNDPNFEVCPHCGRYNPKGAVSCHACGEFMHKYDANTQQNKNPQQNPFNPFDTNSQDGTPFITFMDPMGGVSPEEDFDGVTGAEIAKCVKVNTPYYMQVFSRIKVTGSSRFNFAAFLFGGGWYLYRKQYLKGTILTIIMFLITLGQDFIGYFYTNQMWYSLMNQVGNNATYHDYFSLIFAQYSTGQIILLFMPYILGLCSWILMFWCGFRGNRSYYNHTISKIKKLKVEKSGEELSKTLVDKGGVNTAIAWSLIACEFILMISTLFL